MTYALGDVMVAGCTAQPQCGRGEFYALPDGAGANGTMALAECRPCPAPPTQPAGVEPDPITLVTTLVYINLTAHREPRCARSARGRGGQRCCCRMAVTFSARALLLLLRSVWRLAFILALKSVLAPCLPWL